MGRPATTRDAILRILPYADDARSPKDYWTTHDLAAAIYAGGDAAKVRPAHKAAVGRVLYWLRRAGIVNHTARRSSGGSFFWFKTHPGALGGMPDAADPRQELRQRMAKILGMLGSDHAGERANAAKLVDDLRRESGLTWDQLLGL